MNADRMKDLEVAKGLFPLMAGTDVFEIWLAPIINNCGWPFKGLSDGIAGTEWERVFTWQPLQKIAQLNWHRVALPFSDITFTPQAQSTIDAMFETHVCNFNNPSLLKIKNTRERFTRCYEFTRRTGRTPVPCVLFADVGGYSIFDGNHRLGAMWTVSSESDIPCVLDAWIGSSGDFSNGTNA